MITNGSKYELTAAEQAFFRRHLALADQEAEARQLAAQAAAAQAAVQGALQLLVDQHDLQAQPGHGWNLSQDMTAIEEVAIDGMASNR